MARPLRGHHAQRRRDKVRGRPISGHAWVRCSDARPVDGRGVQRPACKGPFEPAAGRPTRRYRCSARWRRPCSGHRLRRDRAGRTPPAQGSSRGGHRLRRDRRGAGSSRVDGSGRPAVNPPLQHVSSAGSGLGAGPEARQPARGVDVGLDLGPVEEPAAAQWRSPNSTYAASSATSCGCVATPRAPVASSSVSRTSISSAGRGPARGLRSRTSSCRPRGRDEAPARFPPICLPAGGPHT